MLDVLLGSSVARETNRIAHIRSAGATKNSEDCDNAVTKRDSKRTALPVLKRSTKAPQSGVKINSTKGFSPINIPTWDGVSFICLKYKAR